MIASAPKKVNKIIKKTPKPTIQAKLTIGASNDKYEHEADAMANYIMRMPQTYSSQPLSKGGNGIQRKCTKCKEKDENIRRKPLMMKSEGGAPVATQALGSQLNKTKGSGSPLPSGTNSFMGNAFGADFSNVRIHTGGSAIQMNQGLNARAFTHGSDIYFNRGQYQPGSSEGKRLLGHELTHVVQQNDQKTPTLQRYNCPSSSSPAATRRRISGPIDWTVDFDEGDITSARIDHTKNTSDITATAQLPGYLNNSSLFDYMGLTEVRFGHRIIPRRARRGRNTAITVQLRVRYPRIFITRDFPRGSCHYNVVRDFEHATGNPVFLTSFLETIPVNSDLTALTLPTTFGDIEQVALDWCARTTASLEQGLAAAHPIHVATMERDLANCPALSMANCNQSDQAIIAAARSAAQAWIPGTLQRLQNPNAAAVQQLRNHFSINASTAASANQIQMVRNSYTQLLAALNGNQLRFGCVNNRRGRCSNSTTYGFSSLGSFRVDFCTRTYRGMGVNAQTAGLIHEVHHASVPGSLDVASEAYSHQSNYPLSANNSINNPDSFAEFSKAVH